MRFTTIMTENMRFTTIMRENTRFTTIMTETCHLLQSWQKTRDLLQSWQKHDIYYNHDRKHAFWSLFHLWYLHDQGHTFTVMYKYKGPFQANSLGSYLKLLRFGKICWNRQTIWQSLPWIVSPTCPKSKFRKFFYLFKQILSLFLLVRIQFYFSGLQASGLARRLW